MFTHSVARVVTAVALLAASAAWAGWVYLHTAADPTRSDRIAHAILADPQARHEVAADVADGLAGPTNKVLTSHGQPAVADGGDPALQSAVDAALADPRITANLIDAISAEHARALGVAPAHPASVDTGPLIAAVRAHLLPVEPGVAQAIPAIAASQIHLPTARIPYARQLRTWTKRWARVLALGACAGLILALLIGERAEVLRRAGFWALGAALAWALLPPLVAWAGHHWIRSQAAVIRAVLRGATGSVTAAATVLALAGAAGVAVSYLAPHLLGAVPRRTPPRRALRHGSAPAPPAAIAPAAPRAMAASAVPPGRSGPPGAWYPPRPATSTTDTWTRQEPAPAPLIDHDRFGDRPGRRPGVSRGALGLDGGPERAVPTDAGAPPAGGSPVS